MKPEFENIEELFRKFMDKDAAQKAAGDIKDGEHFLNKYPPPEPDAALISAIQSRVKTELNREKYRKMVNFSYLAASVAAAVIIIGVISLKSTNKPPKTRTITDSSDASSIWDSADLSQDDPSLSLLFAKIQEIEDEAKALKDGWNGSESIDTDEIEIEFMEISNDFWKG